MFTLSYEKNTPGLLPRLCFVGMESGVQLGLGEGPINKVGPMSQPRGIDGTASRTLSVANFTLGS